MATENHIVITGASQGIGAAIAVAWAKAYPASSLSLVARNEVNLAKVAAECREFGATAQPFPCDLLDSEQTAEACTTILDRSGPVRVLVNNAGIFAPGGMSETPLAVFEEQIKLNLTSAFQMTALLLPGMIEAGGGHLFFMGSVASVQAYPGSVSYGTAKHGLLGLARAIREETFEQGIRVTTILPGATLTPSWSNAPLPADRFMPPEDIADALISAYKLSKRTVVEEILLRPQQGDI
jgi:short-subunit dehydrogenase